MSRIVNMLDAKTSLSRLVHDLETGGAKEFIIARNGRPAARLVPLQAGGTDREVWASVASLWEIAIKHGVCRGDMPISSAMALQAFQDAGYGLLCSVVSKRVAGAQRET